MLDTNAVVSCGEHMGGKRAAALFYELPVAGEYLPDRIRQRLPARLLDQPESYFPGLMIDRRLS